MQSRTCSPAENECYQKLRHNTFDCRVPCTGLFADVNVKKAEQFDFIIENDEERQKFDWLQTQYGKYEADFLEKIDFTNFDNIYTGHPRFNYSK